MSIWGLIYNKYEIHIKFIRSVLELTIIKDKKELEVILIYGRKTLLDLLYYLQLLKIPYVQTDESINITLYGDESLKDFKNDLIMFEELYKVSIF